ncbi:MAG: hypothetical protein ABFE07_06485 [Armatimonadia bacterium]
MTDLTALKELLERVEKATEPSKELNGDIAVITGQFNPADCYRGRLDTHGDLWYGGWHRSGPAFVAPPYTSSIDACVALIEKVLPGWWWSTGRCALTGDASIGPDYNGPDRERLFREFPVERFDGGIHADLPPGDGPHRCCYALLHVLLSALIAKKESNA